MQPDCSDSAPTEHRQATWVFYMRPSSLWNMYTSFITLTHAHLQQEKKSTRKRNNTCSQYFFFFFSSHSMASRTTTDWPPLAARKDLNNYTSNVMTCNKYLNTSVWRRIPKWCYHFYLPFNKPFSFALPCATHESLLKANVIRYRYAVMIILTAFLFRGICASYCFATS